MSYQVRQESPQVGPGPSFGRTDIPHISSSEFNAQSREFVILIRAYTPAPEDTHSLSSVTGRGSMKINVFDAKEELRFTCIPSGSLEVETSNTVALGANAWLDLEWWVDDTFNQRVNGDRKRYNWNNKGSYPIRDANAFTCELAPGEYTFYFFVAAKVEVNHTEDDMRATTSVTSLLFEATQ